MISGIKKSLHILLLVFLWNIPLAVAQTEPPQFFTLDGRLFEAGSQSEPLMDASVVMTIQVLNPAKTCILYEEQQTISTLLTSGYFSVRVGSAVGAPKRSGADSGNSLSSIFYNSTAPIAGVAPGGGGCGYTPVAGDERYFRFFITPSTVGSTSQLSPDMTLDSVPQAIVAQTLQGLGPSDVFRTSVTSTQAKLDNLLTSHYTALNDLASGTSGLYLQNTSQGTQMPSTAADPVAPNAGQMWYNSTTNELKYYNGTTTEVVGSGGGGGVTSIATGAGLTGGPITATGTISIATGGVTNAMLATGIDASKITVGTLPAGVVPTGTDDTKLPLVGGTMTGAIIMGADTTFSGYNLLGAGHITMNAQRTITIGRFTAAEETALVGTLTPVNAGATWYNSTTGKLMYWNGTIAQEMGGGAGDITSVVAGTGLTGGALTGDATLNIDIGNSAGQLFTIDSVPNCGPTQKLQMSAGPAYTWSCVADNDSGGDITAVNTTAPLSGGATTGAVNLTLNYDNTSVGVNGSSQLEVRDSGVTTAKLANLGVTTAKIADDAITSGKILDGEVATADIANSAITTAKINDGAVTGVKLEDSGVVAGTYTKVTVDTKGRVLSATNLVAADIPNLDAAKITSGVLDAARIPTGTDDTKLPLLGGTMTGNINMDGNQILNVGHITQANQSTITVGRYTTAQETTLVGTLTPANKGALWFNTDTNLIMYWDGAAAQELSTAAGAGGDITAVLTNAGSGLSGGAGTGSVALTVVTDNTTVEVNGSNQVQVKDLGITSGKLANDAVTSAKIQDGTITNADVNAAAAIAWSKIDKTGATAADVGAVPTSRQINTTAGSGLVGGGDLTADRNLSINTDNTTLEVATNTLQLKDGGVNAAKLADSSVTSAKIADGTVATADIADGAVTDAKVTSLAVNKISSAMGQYFTYAPNGAACNNGEVLKWNLMTGWECAVDSGGVTDHGALTGLADDDHTQYVMLAGRTGGQSIIGGTAASNNLTLESTSDATKGNVVLQPNGGNVGIGTTTPATALDVDGTIKVADGGEACAIAANAGMIRYSAGTLQYCNGSAWQTLGVSGAGLTTLNGQTGNTQTFAVGATGLAPAFSSAANTHTLNIPLASGAGVTSGTISKADYDSFVAKLSSVDGSTLSSARLWVGNSSNQATAVLMSGDATLSNTGVLTIANSAITTAKINDGAVTGAKLEDSGAVAGTYTKVTVDAKGRVLSATNLVAADIPNLDAAKITSGVFDAARIPTGTDDTKLPLAGGTMTGNINMDGNQILNVGHITQANQSTITVGRYTTAQETTLVGTLAPANKGALWFNTDTNLVMYWDGAAAQELSTAAGAGGDITAVLTNAGSGLSGGAGTGSVALTVVTDNTTVEVNGSNQVQVKDLGITSAKLANDAVTNAKLAADAVTSAKILDGTIATADVADSAVSSAKLANDAVTSAKIQDGTITNADVNAAAAIAWSKIDKTGATAADVGAVPSSRQINTNAGSGLTGGGDLTANRNIAVNVDNTTIEVATNTVQLKDAAVSTSKLADSSVTSAKIADGTIATADIADGAVTNAKVTSLAVNKISSAMGQYFMYAPNGAACNNGEVLKWNLMTGWECAVDSGGVTDHGALTGLADDDHTQYVMLAGRTGGQSIIGGTAASNNLTLESTSDATKGNVVLQPNGGNVGIGTTTPATALDVDGTIKVADGGEACAIAANAGMIRYSAGTLQYCNGSAWQTLGVSGAGLTTLNGQTGNTQTFAVGSTGLAPAFSSAANTHTLNIPLASGAGVTSGTISKADYDSFVAKLSAVDGSPLNSARLWVGNSSNAATAVLMSGDATLSNTGALTIGANAITTAKINDGAITSAKILDGTIATADVADSVITAAKLADNAVTSAKIVDGTIATADIANSSVTDAKIAGVGVEKITSGAGNYLTYRPNNIACTNNQVLKWDNTNSRWICANDDGGAVASVFGRTGAVVAQSGDYTATQITNTPAGTIAATNVQTALNELDSEKVSKAGDTMSGQLTMNNAVMMNAQNQLRLGDGDSSNYVALRSPATVASNVTLTLPATAGTNGQVLATDGAGVLSWTTVAGGSVTNIATGSGLTGGPITTTGTISIATSGVTTTHLADGTIATVDIADVAVTAAKLANDSVTSAKIVNGTIATADVADSAIATAKIADNAISTAKISNSAVTDAKIAGVSVNKITSAATQYFTYAPNGAACNNGEILKWNLMTGWECAVDSSGSGTVTNIATGSGLTGGPISTTGTISIATGGVTTTHILNGTIATADIADSAIATAKLANNAVTSAKILDGTVATADVADDAIATAKIANGAVTDAKIGTVGVQKITSGAAQYLTYRPNNVACANGQVLSWDNTNSRWVCANDAGATDHGALAGLTDDDHTQYVMLAGRAGGQNLRGGNAASNNLTLESTSNATKGDVILQPTGGDVAIGTTAPASKFDVAGAITSRPFGVAAGQTGQVALRELAANGVNTVSVRSPDLLAADYVLTLPTTAGTNGQALITNGTGVLSWANVGTGSVTNIATGSGLTGGPITTTGTISIATDGVTTSHILNGTIATADVADSAVATAKIANGAVTDAKIATMGVQKLANGAGQYLTYRPNNVACTNGQVLSWDNTNSRWICASAATGTVTNIATGSGLTGGPITNTGTVSIATGGVTSTHLLDGTIAAADLADGAVTTVKLANDSVTSAKIVDGTIATADLADSAVATAKIANGAVTDAKIGTVGVQKITSGAAQYLTYRPNNVACTNGQVLSWDNTNSRWVCANDAGATDHGALAGLTDDDHTQYVMLAGRAGGQNLRGGNAASNNLTLESTSNATKGDVILQPTGGDVAIGTTAPASKFDVAGAITSRPFGVAAGQTGQVALRELAANGVNTVTVRSPDLLAADYVLTLPATAGTNGQALTTNGTGVLSWASVGTGSVTNIATGSGLTGGPITTTGTISIATGGVTSTHILDATIASADLADSAVATAKIANGAVTDAKIATVGVQKITSGAAQYLTYRPNNVACTNGQVLSWDNTNSRWVCATAASGTVTNIATGSGLTGGPITSTGTVSIATSGVTSTHLLDGTIAAADLADGAVTSVKIVDGTIASADLADSAVATAKIANGAVTDAKIATVGVQKITSGAAQYLTYRPNNVACTNGQVLSWDNTNSRWICANDAGATDHGALAGLTDDDHTQYVMLAGRAGGQNLRGGNAASNNLTLESTSNATKGDVILQPTGGDVAIGTTAPASKFDVAGAITSRPFGVAAGQTGQVALRELAANGVNTVTVRSPDLLAADYVLTLPATAGTNGQALTTNGTGVLSWASVGTGSVTNIATGSGLTGGPITTTGTISIATGGVTTTHILNGTIATADVADSAVATAKIANGAVTDAKIATVGVQKIASGAAQYLTYRPNNVACTNGQVLSWDNTNSRWICASAATGTVTNIATGSGLTGGPITNTGTVSIATGGVTSTHLLDGTIAAADLADGAVTSAKIVDGTIATADVADSAVSTAKIANGAVTDAKIATVGVQKIASGAAQYLTYRPNNVACTNGQVLSWDNTNSRWVCANDAGATDHGALAGLTDDDHTQYVMLAGRAGGQNLRGGNAASNNLTLESTSNATKGDVILQPTGGDVAIGTTAPASKFDVAGAITSRPFGVAAGQTGQVALRELAANGVNTVTVRSPDLLAADYVLTLPATAGTNGQALTTNGAGVLSWASVGTGSVTNIATGSGLTGGPITTTGTISIATGGVTTTHILNGTIATADVADSAVATAKIANGAVTDAKIATVGVQKLASGAGNYLTYRPNNVACANGQILSWDNTNSRWICASAATGTVTSIATGSGLTGGPITGAGTVSISTGGVTSTHILNGTIATADVANGAVTDAKIATVGVQKLANGVGNYFTYRPNNVACTNGQTLEWDNTNSRWICATDTGVTDHGALTGLTDDDHTQYVMLAGRAGGQNLRGGTAASENLTLESTSNATKGTVILQPTTGNVGVGTTTAATKLHVNGALTMGAAPTPMVAAGTGDIIAGDTSGGFQFDASANDMYAQQSTADNAPVGILIRKSRGTTAAPTVITTGDDILNLRGYAHDGTSFVESSRINFDTEGTIGTGIVPGMIKFLTGNSAGVLTQRMVINSAGEVGIGTTTPDAPVDVLSPNNTIASNNGNLFLRSSDAMAQNLGGQIAFGGNDGAFGNRTFAMVSGRKENATSADYAGYLSLITRPAGANSVERVRVTSTGDVGIGTTVPVNKLDVAGAITSRPFGTAAGQTGQIEMRELAANGVNTVSVRSPDLLAADYVLTLPTTAGTNGQALITNGTGVLSWASVGTGSVTNIATGSGLTGGPITGTGTISIATGGVTTTHILNGTIATADVADSAVSTAKIANGAVTDAKIATMGIQKLANGAGNYLTYRPNNVACTNGQVLSWDNTNSRWICASAATGTVTSIATGSGLTGGPITATGTVSIATGGVTTTHILNGTIATADVANGAVTDAKIATMGVQKLASSAGNYLTYRPNNVACTNGQVLSWDNTNSRWICGSAGVADHGSLAGIADDDHTQYVMLAGRAGGQNLRGGTAASNNLTLESTSNATKGRIIMQPTGGSVGIGTTTTSARFEVQSAAADNMVAALIDAGGDAGGEHGLHVLARSDLNFAADAVRISANRASSAAYNLINTVVDADGTPSTPFMVRGDGRVGIGTNAPASALHVNGVITLGASPTPFVASGAGDIIAGDTTGGFQFDASANDLYTQQSSANTEGAHFNFRKSRGTVAAPTVVTTGDDIALLRNFAYDGATFRESSRITFDTTGTISGTAVPGIIRFSTANSAGTLAERMQLSAEGLLGVGTNPAVSIDVSGRTDAVRLPIGTDAQRPTGANGMIRYNSTSQRFEGHENGAWVGLREPSSGADVSASAGTAGAPSLSFSGDPNTGFYSSAADTIGVATAGVNRFNISNGGLVSTTAGGGLVTTANGTATAPTFSFSGDPDTGWFRPTTNTMAAATGGVEQVRIDSAGRVGIGTNSPGSKLDVAGASRFTGNMTIDGNMIMPDTSMIRSSDSTGSLRLFGGVDNTTGSGVQYYGSTSSINPGQAIHTFGGANGLGSFTIRHRTSTVYNPLVTVLPSGNFGIGTTAPSYPLHVDGRAQIDGILRLTNGNGTSNTARIESGDGNDYIRLNSDDTIDFATNDSIRMKITNTGYVGLGTETPSARINIVGTGGQNDDIDVEAYTTTAGNDGALRLARGRGTEAVPASVVSNDSLGTILFRGHDGTGFYTGGQIRTLATSTWSTERSSALAFFTSDNSTLSEKVRISAQGYVGMGTAAPHDLLMLQKPGANSLQMPLRLHNNDGTSTGGSATGIGFKITSDTADSRYKGVLAFERTTTEGRGKFHFLNNAVADGSSATLTDTKMTIDYTGNVGIGTTAPSHILHINGQGRSTVSTWATTSDIRLKDVQGKYGYGLDEILKINTIKFNYKKNNPLDLPTDKTYVGIVAQELQKIIPDAVEETADGYLTVNNDPVHWAMVNAIQDLHGMCKVSQKQKEEIQERIDRHAKELAVHSRDIASLKVENEKLKAVDQKQKQKIENLEKENQDIKSRLERLEKMILNK